MLSDADRMMGNIILILIVVIGGTICFCTHSSNTRQVYWHACTPKVVEAYGNPDLECPPDTQLSMEKDIYPNHPDGHIWNRYICKCPVVEHVAPQQQQ